MELFILWCLKPLIFIHAKIKTDIVVLDNVLDVELL